MQRNSDLQAEASMSPFGTSVRPAPQTESDSYLIVTSVAANDFLGEEWIYIDSTSSANPLHCIHNNPALQRQYYQTMSAAFARMARGSATVMHLNQNLQNPPTHGIWGSIELPQLRTSTDVDQVSHSDFSSFISSSTDAAAACIALDCRSEWRFIYRN